MKHFIYISIFLLNSFAMFALNGITISGKISNAAEPKITIKGLSFDKEIQLKADGTFTATLPIAYDGLYLFFTKNNRTALYLTKTSKLTLFADDANFGKTIKFEGNGSTENNYWQRKNDILTKELSNVQEFYSTEESLYIDKVKNLKNSILTLLNNTKLISKGFKENEVKSINYFEQLQLLLYPKYHAHYAKIENYKLPDSFPKTAAVNYENESDYLFSNHYKQLITYDFNEKIAKLAGEDADYTSALALPEIKKIKNTYFKNDLLKNLAYEISPGNPDTDNLYKELMILIQDEGFKKSIVEKYNKISTLIAGKASPGFNYENFKGGTTSLESLKGKFVYIDVWATWCGPCRREIPFLQKIEEEYTGKNIEFVSLSIDARKDYDKWRKMIEDKKLGGMQLIADNDWQSQFAKDYAIEGIPRFILLDPKGNIISADAPRPSDPKLVEKFKELGI